MYKVFQHKEPFQLENGQILPELKLAYTTYGKRNDEDSNVIWVCHALTADSNVDQWWPELFGQGRVLDPDQYFIVCANFLGSCYGSTGASSPEVPKQFQGKNFPLVNIADMVKAHVKLSKHLKIDKIHLLIGASLGGQQALQWSVHFPDQIKNLCTIATNAFHSPWGIAFNESQRMAMEADESFQKNHPDGGKLGLQAARSIALLSYRTAEIYNQKQSEDSAKIQSDFKASSYQKYQGEKLSKRFSPYAYYAISKSMDSHHLGRGYDSTEQALQQIKAQALCIGIRSDMLFKPLEQRFISDNIKNAEYKEIDSIYGHDGFLVEGNTINRIILEWLKTKKEYSEQENSF